MLDSEDREADLEEKIREGGSEERDREVDMVDSIHSELKRQHMFWKVQIEDLVGVKMDLEGINMIGTIRD